MTDGARLDGKRVLITGGARGLGGAQAELFVERGARVLIADVLDELGQKRAAKLGEAARYQSLDVTREDQWRAAVAAAQQAFGGLDGLVHNAGISPAPKPIVETSLEEYRRVIDVNQVGTFLALRSVIPLLQEAGGGSIVTIASTAGVQPAAGLAPYVSSKYAVRGLSRTAALEHSRDGIRVNSILPGPMDTAMNQPGGWWEGVDLRPQMAQGNPAGRVGEPREVAEMAAFLLSDASSYCNGNDYPVDGGQLAGVFTQPSSFKDG